MAPFIALSSLFLILAGLGAVGVHALAGWYTPLRFALAGMFLLTASAHWGKRRHDLVRMVPPAFPQPDLIVALTGLLEIFGAVGLLLPRLAPLAAGGLSLLLLALFPADVHAARTGVTIAGRPATALGPRTLLQVVFLGATLAVAFG